VPALSRLEDAVSIDESAKEPPEDPPYTDIDSLIRAEGPKMYRLAVGLLRSDADAQDVVQSAAVKMFRNWGKVGALDTAARQRGYCLTTVGNEIKQLHRKPVRSREFPSLPMEDDWVTELDFEQWHLHARSLRKLWNAIFKLPEMRQQVVISYAAGYEYSEIAEMLGISVSAVRSHMSNGRKTLRSSLPEIWEEYRHG
jgi:RNA polymerase sigma-70 factor (ECF subfamily)